MDDAINANLTKNINSELINISFTREELNVLSNILDIATRYEGLRIAETTLFFSKKIQNYLQVKAI